MKTVSVSQVFSRSSRRLWRARLSHCFFLRSFSSPLLGVEPSQNPRWLASGPNETQALMPHYKSSVRNTVIGKRWICRIQREAHSTGCGPSQRRLQQPWNVVWLVFKSWVISYANEWEDHSNNWGTTHSSVFWQWLGTVLAPLGVSFSLQIEDQGLVEYDLSSWTHLILISLCYALGYVILLISFALPPLLLFHAIHLRSVQAHSVASTIFWHDNRKIAGPGREILCNPCRDSGLHLPCFPQHVWQQHLSGTHEGGDRYTMPARSSSVGGIPSRATGLPGTMLATLGVSPVGHLGPNPYYPSPKVTNIPLDQIFTLLLQNSWSVASYQFVLKPLTNSYSQDPAPL